MDGRINVRSDTTFSTQEYDVYKQLAGQVIKSLGNNFYYSTSGLQFAYIPAIAKGPTFTFQRAAKENGNQIRRTRVGLNIQFYDTLAQAGIGPIYTFATPTIDLMGSLAKKANKTSLSKALNLYSIFTRVYNDNGVTLTAGTAIKFNGVSNGGVLEVERTDGNDSNNNFAGIIQEDIPTGKTGCAAAITGPGAWVPNATISTPTNGGLLYLNGDTGGISHTPGGGSQIIGRLLHVGTSDGAHYVSFNGA